MRPGPNKDPASEWFMCFVALWAVVGLGYYVYQNPMEGLTLVGSLAICAVVVIALLTRYSRRST